MLLLQTNLNFSKSMQQTISHNHTPRYLTGHCHSIPDHKIHRTIFLSSSLTARVSNYLLPILLLNDLPTLETQAVVGHDSRISSKLSQSAVGVRKTHETSYISHYPSFSSDSALQNFSCLSRFYPPMLYLIFTVPFLETVFKISVRYV